MSNTEYAKNHFNRVNFVVCELHITKAVKGFPGGSEDKESACNVGNLGTIPGVGRSSGEGNSNPLQYSCLKNPMDRVWWTTVHGIAELDTTE